MKVVIIDDERLARKELSNLLAEFKDIEIVGEAANADEAEEMIDNLNPDLIFLDLYMPIIDGESCLKILRKKMDLKNVPVIIYSSEKETDKLEGLLSMGANGFLKKPQSYSELLESLRNIHDEFLQNQEKPEVDFEYFIKESIINGY